VSTLLWIALVVIALSIVGELLRRACRPSAQDRALEARDADRDRLQAVMARLGPNAQSRLRGLLRSRDDALQQLPQGAFRDRWEARLGELVQVGIDLLVMLDANKRPSPQRDSAVVQLDQIQDLIEALVRAPLEGRDPAALDARLVELDALTGAARESMAALKG